MCYRHRGHIFFIYNRYSYSNTLQKMDNQYITLLLALSISLHWVNRPARITDGLRSSWRTSGAVLATSRRVSPYHTVPGANSDRSTRSLWARPVSSARTRATSYALGGRARNRSRTPGSASFEVSSAPTPSVASGGVTCPTLPGMGKRTCDKPFQKNTGQPRDAGWCANSTHAAILNARRNNSIGPAQYTPAPSV